MSAMISNTSAIITTVVSTLGTGILYMPAAFHSLGFIYATVAISLVGMVTYFSLYFLAYAAIQTDCAKDGSYPELANKFSKKLKIMVDITLFGSDIGTAMLFVRNFSEYGSVIIKYNIDVSIEKELLRKIIVFFIVIITMYFFTKKSLSSLSFISKISISSAIFYNLLNLYYGLKIGKPNCELLSVGTDFTGGIVKFVFALHCQFSFLSIFKEMADQSTENISLVCILSSLFGAVIYATAGYFGYKAVGQDICGLSMLNIFQDATHPFMIYIKENTFDKGAYLPQLVVGLFMFIFFGAIVFSIFPIIPVLQNYITISSKPVSRNAIILIIGAISFSSAITESFFGLLLDIVGAVFTNPLSFIYPSIFMILVSPRFSISYIISYILIILSSALLVSSVIQIMSSLI